MPLVAQLRAEDATDLFTRSVIRREVPLAAGSTPFLLVGDVVGTVSVVGLVGLILAGLWPRRREEQS